MKREANDEPNETGSTRASDAEDPSKGIKCPGGLYHDERWYDGEIRVPPEISKIHFLSRHYHETIFIGDITSIHDGKDAQETVLNMNDGSTRCLRTASKNQLLTIIRTRMAQLDDLFGTICKNG